MALRLSSAPLAALSLPPSLSPSRLEAGRLFFSIRRPLVRCYSSKKKETSFTDRILDYIEGGPKLRKWYGAPDRLPKDGGLEVENESSEIEEVRDAVLVTDGESEIGQMVILSLILKRARVKALVKDKQAAVDAFGGYVEDGFFSDIGQMKGVQHIVLLSQLAVYRGSSGLQAIMNGKLRKLAEKDEEMVIASGIPYTIIRAGLLQNTPGGMQGFSFGEGVAAKGKLSKEDAAVICVEALDAVPQRGLVFEVVNGEEKVPDWKEWFAALIKSTEELQ
ncbi:uncharacterized protein [Elaeis guineensis]|uniref:uncharacterized protein isoform X3 n=1 Tax=Elaeis guineensis var. tenera TaxID=51953 RepID=UPI003C6CD27F